MASALHKKRTGKGFKITEEIVAEGEMYEEQDEDFPLSYRLLSANIKSSSADMNARLEAYLSNKVEVSKMLARANDEWRGNEINKPFAPSFPNAALPVEKTAQNIPNATVYKEPHEACSSATCSLIPRSSLARISEPAAIPAIVISITDRRRAAPKRRGSRASASPTARGSRHSLKKTPSLETEITRTTLSIKSTTSPQTPTPFDSLNGFAITTEWTSQETEDYQIELNSPTKYDHLEMPQTNQTGTEGTGLLLKYCGNETDKMVASKHLVPCILYDDDPWQAFFNDSIWATDYQQ